MDSKSQPLVSVVTPVYNGEKYLAECIESVLAQTYDNWEYVIVNNCSTDRTLEIAQHYAQQDARIRIHTNAELLPIMPNWNHALRQISPESKYCKVVHADDWLFPDCIMEMVKVAEANPSVGLVSAYRLNGNIVDLDGLSYPSTAVPARELCRLTLLDSDLYLFGSPTSLLLRSDLIRSRPVFYDESLTAQGLSNIYADVEACYDVLQEADFGFVHQVLTYTRMHEESQTSIYWRFNTRIIGRLRVLKKYGSACLNHEEFENRLEQILQSYYRFLGKGLLQRREKEFWDYHQEGLEKLGLSLNRQRLIKAAAKEFYLQSIYYLLLHPKATVRSIIGFITQAIRPKNPNRVGEKSSQQPVIQ